MAATGFYPEHAEGLPHFGAVPSALRGLTSLFGMGRGEHPWKNHHKKLTIKN